MSFISGDIPADVEEFALSPDDRQIAIVVNEEGISKLHLIDSAKTLSKSSASVRLPEGIISRLLWHSNSADLALKLESPTSPGDIYVVNPRDGEAVRWKKSGNPALKDDEIAKPQVFRYGSFDERRISGLIYRPPAKFTGRRPVLIDIHGGPDEQARPYYLTTENVYTNDFGIVRICPNVRGSTGYGKTFHQLDDGLRREDAVKDVGALLDWVGKQPDLDASRVIVLGYSYGGYMSLMTAARFGERIRGAISFYGISNIVTFLENTASWRRETRRAEYGDERDARVRAGLEKLAPVNNVSKITKPLFIAQGANDPRIPAQDAEKMAQAAKKNGVTVWYILAKDEGHGFSVLRNRLYVEAATYQFLKKFLLDQSGDTP
jgi:dipeptidyl aminopeptidase/acylaminoacyl peptidase